MDIANSFTFMFEDPEWLRKLGIGFLVVLLGALFSVVLIGLVPLIMVLGYILDVTRNVLDGQANPLPEWNDWEGFLRRGLKLAGVLIVWSLPLILISIPLGFGAALAGNGNQSNIATAMGSLISLCGACLALGWGLVFLVFTPAIYIRLARTNRFSSGFEFAKLWAFTRENISNVIVAILLIIVAGLVSGFASIFVVTIPLVMLWKMLVEAHLYGQVGARSITAVA
jgi:hypothetical protein